MAKKEVFFKQSSEILRTIYLERKKRNPRYSNRAFARDLGLGQSLVSLIMNGKRNLTLAQAIKIATLLSSTAQGIKDAEKILCLTIENLPGGKSVLQKRHEKNQDAEISFQEIEVEKLKIISAWYHLPILDLSTTQDFVSESQWIAKRLDIKATEAKIAMQRLVTVGLAKIEDGVFKKVNSKIEFMAKSSEGVVRWYHSQMMKLAQAQLTLTDQASFEAREISGVTIAVSEDRIDEAKDRIVKFQKELTDFLSQGKSAQEVYQLNVQFFPLTKKLKLNKD